MASDALVIIGSGNGLWPVWHQAISSTNVGFLIIGPLWTTLGTFNHNSNKLMWTGLHGRVIITTDPNAETSMWGFWSWQSQRNLISLGNVSAYLISCCTGPKCHIIRIKRYISTKLHIFLNNDWYLQNRQYMMTSSNGNIFRVTGHLCGEFTGEFPAQRPVTRNFDVFFDLHPNEVLSKQS